MQHSENQILSDVDSLRVMTNPELWRGKCLPLIRRRHDPRTGDWLDHGFLWHSDVVSAEQGVSVYVGDAWPTVDEQEKGIRYITTRFPRFNYASCDHVLQEGWRVILDQEAQGKADL